MTSVGTVRPGAATATQTTPAAKKAAVPSPVVAAATTAISSAAAVTLQTTRIRTVTPAKRAEEAKAPSGSAPTVRKIFVEITGSLLYDSNNQEVRAIGIKMLGKWDGNVEGSISKACCECRAGVLEFVNEKPTLLKMHEDLFKRFQVTGAKQIGWNNIDLDFEPIPVEVATKGLTTATYKSLITAILTKK